MSQRIAAVLFLALVVPALAAQAADPSAYLGLVPPGRTPVLFGPGIVSTPANREFGICFSPKADEIFFTRKAGERQDIYRTAYRDGAWSAPTLIDVLAAYESMEPFLSPDGRTLYFDWSSPIPPGAGGPILTWAIDRLGEGWSLPRAVGTGMYLSMTREGLVYITDVRRGSVARSSIVQGRLGALAPAGGGVATVNARYGETAHPAVAPDGSYLVFDIDWAHLFVCFRTAAGGWGPPVDLAEHGLPAEAGTAAISPDGKYFFYRWKDDIWWVEAGFITDLAPASP